METSFPNLTVPSLAELDWKTDGVERFGGKAVGLARLSQTSGFPTSPGFVLEATSTSPEQWETDLLVHLQEQTEALLQHGRVAVRSSGVREDSAEQSFAGLFESFLELASWEEVLKAMGDCIASGRSQRVLEYAGDKEPIPVAVVVQQMVEARAAGVLFTRDPHGTWPGMLVEAVEGTGEALVSGQVEPSGWRLFRNGQGELEIQSSSTSNDDPLTKQHLQSLEKMGRTLAESWQEELDIEWALNSDDELILLQARPITTGQPWTPPIIQQSAANPQDPPITVWTNFNVRESMPNPMTPLTWSVWKKNVVPMITRDTLGVEQSSPAFPHAQCLDLINGRIYINLSAMLTSRQMQESMPKLMSYLDQGAADVVSGLLEQDLLQTRVVPGSRGNPLRILWKKATRGVSLLWELLRPRRALETLQQQGAAIAARTPVENLSNVELLREFGLLVSPETHRIQQGLALAQGAFFLWMLTDRLFAKWPKAQALLAAGVLNNPTTQISVEVDNLIETAIPLRKHFDAVSEIEELFESLLRASENAPALREWLQRFRRFQARYGHRGPGELELGIPGWSEDPTMILQLVKLGLESPPKETVEQRLQNHAALRKTVIAEAIQQASFFKRPLLRLLSSLVPLYMPLREAPKDQMIQVLHRIRLAALEAGRRLKKRSILEKVEDIFFLETEEIKDCLQHEDCDSTIQSMVAFRRQQLEAFQDTTAYDFVRSDGIPVHTHDEDANADFAETGVLKGLGIGGETIRGRVRVLTSPEPRLLESGDILVVRFADPGWTPLFPRVKAVVMEVGGLMCHAAVIARELNIPAVFGVKYATSLLKDGDELEVSGREGVLTLLAREED